MSALRPKRNQPISVGAMIPPCNKILPSALKRTSTNSSRANKLRFCEHPPTEHFIARISDLTEEEIEATWFTSMECTFMKNDASDTAAALAAGFGDDVDARGLESLTEQGAWISYKARQDIYDVVLGEQEQNERARRKNNWEKLAQLSADETANSLAEALARAKKDQKEARLAYISPPLPWSIRSKKSRRAERRKSMPKLSDENEGHSETTDDKKKLQHRRKSMPRKTNVDWDSEENEELHALSPNKEKKNKLKKKKVKKGGGKNTLGSLDSLTRSPSPRKQQPFYESPRPNMRKKVVSAIGDPVFVKASRRSRSNLSESSTDVTADLSDMSDSSSRNLLDRSDSVKSLIMKKAAAKTNTPIKDKKKKKKASGSAKEKSPEKKKSTKKVNKPHISPLPLSAPSSPAKKKTTTVQRKANHSSPLPSSPTKQKRNLPFPSSPIKKKNAYLVFSPKKDVKARSPLLSPTKKKRFCRLDGSLSPAPLSPAKRFARLSPFSAGRRKHRVLQ